MGTTLKLPRICPFRTLSSRVTSPDQRNIRMSVVCNFCSSILIVGQSSQLFRKAGVLLFYRFFFVLNFFMALVRYLGVPPFYVEAFREAPRASNPVVYVSVHVPYKSTSEKTITRLSIFSRAFSITNKYTVMRFCRKLLFLLL